MLPPAVAGIGLLAAFGRIGLLGGTLGFLGLEIAFTQVAVVLAVTFVASPFYLRAAISAFEARRPDADRRCPDARRRPRPDVLPRRAAARGRRPRRRVRRSRSPAGSASSVRRSCSPARLQGVTQTLSLAVYEQFDVDFDVALAIGAELVVVSAAILLAVKLVPSWTRSTSTSTTLSAPSASR